MGTLISSGSVALKKTVTCMMKPTDGVFLEISIVAYESMVHLPELNMSSPTRSHSPHFMIDCSLDACQLNWCRKFLAASEDFTHSNSYLQSLSSTSVQAIFSADTKILIKIQYTR